MASLVNGADVLDLFDVLDGIRRVKGYVNTERAKQTGVAV